jgi:hypothetical protein
MNRKNQKKGLLIAPFWEKSDHVGVYRIDRFKRWLIAEGYMVIIIKGGIKNETQMFDWGIEISVRNSIDNITTKLIKLSSKIHTKLFLYIWNTLFSSLSIPDANRLWARKVLKQSLINNNIEDINFVISSSPPHSSHIVALNISKNLNIPLIVDLRDGWLDDPLHPSIKRWKIREKLEKKWEMRILKHASQIFVTSQNWKNLLTNRISTAKSKTKVLTNAYPLYEFIESSSAHESKDNNRNIMLLHAGKFLGTRYSNTVDLLLRPFLDHIEYFTDEIEITLLGNLSRKDLYELKQWFNYFKNSKCTIWHKPRVSRTKMFEYILSTDGLLLLAASQAFIPSKTFEYIKSEKPILVVTLEDSSVWNLAKDVPQMFVYDYTSSKKDYDIIDNFLNACRTGKFEINVPNQYSEEHLSKIFIRSIEGCLD